MRASPRWLLVASATALTTMAFVPTATAASATTCFGQPATIVATGPTTRGTPGDDVIVGTDNSDAIFGRAGNDLICGMGGQDLIDGGGGNDQIDGGAGGGELHGGPGDDVLIGGADSGDVLFGGAGRDSLDGGPGIDTVSFNELPFSNNPNCYIVVDLEKGLSHGPCFGRDTIANFENVMGSSGTDTVRLDDGPNGFNGERGGDLVYGLGGDDNLNSQTGTPAGTAHGGSGTDRCVGFAVITSCEVTQR